MDNQNPVAAQLSALFDHGAHNAGDVHHAAQPACEDGNDEVGSQIGGTGHNDGVKETDGLAVGVLGHEGHANDDTYDDGEGEQCDNGGHFPGNHQGHDDQNGGKHENTC